MSNQITEVRLLSVPLENDYKHTVYFANAALQFMAMNQKVKHVFTNFSYQRKDKYIRIPKHYDDLQDCNYVMYNNTGEDGANWVYAFITHMEYKSDDVTWVYIETDVIQTYMFKYSVKPSFIEREHVDDDTIGLHTVPENLEMGEYICQSKEVVKDLQDLKIVMGITEWHDGTTEGGKFFNGIYSGIGYYAYPEGDGTMLTHTLESFAGAGKAEAVTCLFLAPKFLAPTLEDDEVVTEDHTIFKVIAKTKPVTKTVTLAKNQNPYTPKNNKLHCYPYNYLLVSNNNGASAIYQYEHFNEEITFAIDGVLTPGCSIRMNPLEYKGVAINVEEGLNLGKYPILNWQSDIYTNWLTQNGVNIAINMVSGLGQIIAGGVLAVGTGGAGIAVGGGQIASGASQIANQVGQIHQMSFTPPQAQGNINCGDVITASDNNTFTFYGMSIKEEYTQIIDEYFNMFGYKCNRVKVPNSNHRETWWYTKTIDVNIDGEIRNEDLQKIKNAYNNGITFWRAFANMGDYTMSNNIK